MNTNHIQQTICRKANCFSVFILLLSFMLGSCQEESPFGGDTPERNVKLNVLTDYRMADEPMAGKAQTRATATAERYIIEIYSDAACTIPAKVLDHNTRNRAVSTNGEFSVTLDNTKTYYCLLWADNDPYGWVYNTNSLKAITLKAKKTPKEAFHGKLQITANAGASITATLHRAVANVTLKETGTLPKGMVMLKFSQRTTFNVATGTPTGDLSERNEVVFITGPVAATPAAPETLNTPGSIYVLASAETADSVALTFNTGHKSQWTVSKAPLQANYNSNITGHYTSIPVAEVGDFYYQDGTFSTEYEAQPTNPCIGIVYWKDPDDVTRGKIVSLDQSIGFWGKISLEEAATIEGITSRYDGAAGTRNLITAHKDESDFATVYEAFNWIHTTKNQSDLAGRWYLPALYELEDLRGSEQAVMKVVNASLSKIDGVVLLDTQTPQDHWYWSSSEQGQNQALMFRLDTGSYHGANKEGGRCCLRAISVYSLL